MLGFLSRSPKALKKLKLVSYNQSNGVGNQSSKHPAQNEVVNVATASDASHQNVPNISSSRFPAYNPVINPSELEPQPRCNKNAEPRTNQVGIQMLPAELLCQLFGNNIQYPTIVGNEVKHTINNLKKYGLKVENADISPQVDLKLPPLEGSNIEEHFKVIGENQSAPYRRLTIDLVAPLPEKPKVWELQSGWTRYAPGEKPEKVSFPSDEAMVVDVEVCKKAGEMPTLAIAASPSAWYGWVSSDLVNGVMPSSLRKYDTDQLIPLESYGNQRGTKVNDIQKIPRIVVGHNVMYDRARLKEQYWLQRSGMKFLDTMSLHICVSGVTSFQKMKLMKAKKELEEEKSEHDSLDCDIDSELYELQSNSSLNSLGEVLKLYCNKTVDKSSRDLFIDGSLDDIRQHFQSSMSYCASDVSATHDILQVLFPLFLERFPHPVTLAGMLEISMAYLPVNSNWERYLNESRQIYEDLNVEASLQLAQQADTACRLLQDEKYRSDLWMWDEDWSVNELRLTKRKIKADKIEEIQDTAAEKDKLEADGTKTETILRALEKKSQEFSEDVPVSPEIKALENTRIQLPKRPPLLPGYPAWYRQLCLKPSDPEWSPGPQLLTTKKKVAPKLLHLTWERYPLHFIRGKGWGSLRPSVKVNKGADDKKIEVIEDEEICAMLPVEDLKHYWNSIPEKDRKFGGEVLYCGVMFSKLPHKNGPKLNVGNPLGRDFISKFEEKILSGDAVAQKMMDTAKKLSYWRNNRNRIMEQVVVWLKPRDLPSNLYDSSTGIILPQLIVCGTLTRRAVERTWMTASNVSQLRVGSELRAMVQAPPGYSIIGADVDSQELWIASLIGDAYATKIHGGTPFGWMTLSGKKSDGTDMHSVTAKAAGISRDQAKVINYARIYGAGTPFAEQLLKQFNPSMTPEVAREKARKMFQMTKGKRQYRPKKQYVHKLKPGLYSFREAKSIAERLGKKREEVFKTFWVEGTESAMFNRLEEIASDDCPNTPFLNGRLSRALENQDDKNLPTRINWVVQSGAVDFLHLLLVAFRWLEPNARFCLSFHDEVRYLVPDNDVYRASLALHAAHLLTRAFCASRVGMTDLPLSVAFFSSVEVDKTLRKEAHDNCQTPSNPHGLQKGYGIPLGETLNIYRAIEKAGGPLALLPSNKDLKRRKDVSGNQAQTCDE